MPNCIQLKGDDGMREEGFAYDGTIKPGHACVRDSNNLFRRNAAANYGGLLMIAIEDALQGKTINDAYAVNSVVFVYEPEPGDMLYVRVPAGAAAIVAGDSLALDATGCFVKQAGTNPVKMIAREALDNSGGGSEAFIRAEAS